MKRTDIYRIYPLAAALLLAGCMVEESDGSRADVPVMLTATVLETGHGPMATRAGVDVQSTQLPNGATFRAEFSGSDVTETTATYTADGTGGATASPQPYFTLTGTSTTVSAYHGKSGGTGGTQVTGATTSFTVASDQTGDDAYRASDLMYATATVQKSNPVGALTFTHRMAKIIVEVTGVTGEAITKITDVRIIGGSRTINVTNTTTCTLGSTLDDANSTSSYVTMYKGGTGKAAFTCAALIPPQTINGAFLLVETDVGDITYSLTNKTFDSGKSYTYSMAISYDVSGELTATLASPGAVNSSTWQ